VAPKTTNKNSAHICTLISASSLKASTFDLHAKQGLQGAQQVGSHRRGEWNDDSQESIDKPDLSLLPLSGIGKCLLERRE